MGEQIAASWTKEGLKTLRRLYFAGYSMAQIAAGVSEVMGWPMTRNAVSGRIYRQGWVREGSRYTPAQKSSLHAKSRAARDTPQFRVLKTIPARAPGRKSGTLLQLGASQCRFPVGEASGVMQLFCGEATTSGTDYCPRCARRMVVKRRVAAGPKHLGQVVGLRMAQKAMKTPAWKAGGLWG